MPGDGCEHGPRIRIDYAHRGRVVAPGVPANGAPPADSGAMSSTSLLVMQNEPFHVVERGTCQRVETRPGLPTTRRRHLLMGPSVGHPHRRSARLHHLVVARIPRRSGRCLPWRRPSPPGRRPNHSMRTRSGSSAPCFTNYWYAPSRTATTTALAILAGSYPAGLFAVARGGLHLAAALQ